MPRKQRKWNCKECNEQKTEGQDPGLQCVICLGWLGLECTKYTKDVYDYFVEQKVEPNYICPECKETLPELHDLLEVRRQQKKLRDDLDLHDTRITRCEVETEKINEMKELIDQINGRLSAVEAKMIDKEEVATIADKCFKDSDFPLIEEVKNNQAKTTKKLEDAIKVEREERFEDKRREDNKKSLIVYGVPEEFDDDVEQTKADFTKIKELYTNRVNIQSKDFLQIARLGNKKGNQIRPIKLMFVDMERRSGVLRNNKDLILYKEGYDECKLEYCTNDEDHKHIYITNDKTKQQREEEKKLRDELRIKKQAEPNTEWIIRYGKIIKKSTNQARWLQIADGL